VPFVAIVPAYAAERTIARTLTALCTLPVGVVERIIVVASPGDRSAEIAATFDRVIVLRAEARLSAGAARNLGRRAAPDAHQILFVDADCVPRSGTVDRLLAAVTADGYALAAASVASRPGGGVVAWLRHLLEFKDAVAGVDSPTPWLVPSATIACRCVELDRVGGFPDMWPGEDWVVCERLHGAGAKVGRVEGAVTDHDHPHGWRELFAHQYRLGRTSAQARAITGMRGYVFAKHPWLSLALLAGRAWRGVAWVLRNRPVEIFPLVALFPAYVAGLATWTLGFAGAARASRR